MQTLRGIEAALADKQSMPQERELLASLPSAFSMLEALREPDRTLVRSVVVTLTRGMEADLTTFPGEESGLVAALGDAAALDQYIYHVAGCVGEFWTAITMAHTASLKGWDAQQMSQAGVRFGKALQLTNVLRDVPRDLSIGRCYLPRSELSGVGITPEELRNPLRNPSLGPRARPVLAGWIVVALEHYAAAEEYLLAIPRRCLRLRLAVLWPMLIGLATLARLARNESWLDPARPSRVSRRWIYRMLALSLLAAGSNQALRAWIRRLRRRVEEAV
jgi:farnesyl-diphosphate farnesyltransferase